MPLTERSVIKQIAAAKTAEDVLGPPGDSRKHRYRRIMQMLHPDVNSDPRAAKALSRLGELLTLEVQKAKVGYNVTTKVRTYEVGDLYKRGRVANLYYTTYEREGAQKLGLLKLPRSPADNDLMQSEARIVKRLCETKDPRASNLPRLEESFKHRDARTHKDRWATVFRKLPGVVSMAEIKEAQPDGMDPRDLAWMWRRVYAAISLAHDNGIVHGALVPEHILVLPEQHGVLLCGWGGAVEVGDKLKVMGGPAWLYPREVVRKEPVGLGTDVYLMHQTFLSMMGQRSIPPLRAFIQGCTQPTLSGRPQDVHELLAEFDDLLRRLERTPEWGPRQYREFRMPEKIGV